MAVGKKRGKSYPVYVYDPTAKRKLYVGSRERQRDAEALFRAETERRSKRIGSDETCDSFVERWTLDYPRAEESTNVHNGERAAAFGRDFAGRSLRSISRPEARRWANEHPGRLPAVRAMFNDAVEDGLADTNPFARLGMPQAKGGKVRSPVTPEQLDELGETALAVHGPVYGPEFRAMIYVAAYTGLRFGELAALRWSDLNHDVINVQRQFSSTLNCEKGPKHGSTGEILLPPPAGKVLKELPRRLGDDLIFRTKRGRQFRQESLHRYWHPVRCAFGRPDLVWNSLRHFCATYLLNELRLEPWIVAQQLRHDDGGTLVVERYGHPSRHVARDEIRQAFGKQSDESVVSAGQQLGSNLPSRAHDS
jgi:integrase